MAYIARQGAKELPSYARKYYSGGETEIVSMGVEQLMNDPHHFLTKDPEWFGFTVGIMRGEHLSGAERERASRALDGGI
jgi:hypothetical protein